MGNRCQPLGWIVRLGLLLGVACALVVPSGIPSADAQGAPTLLVNGSEGPLTVPLGADLNVSLTGLVPDSSLTVAWYVGADCGLGFSGVENGSASDTGTYSGTLESPSGAPATWFVRATNGPNNSNCVQVSWISAPQSPTPDPTATTAPPPTPTPTIPPSPTPTVTPSPEPSPTPDPGPLVLTVNGGAGPLIARAGDTAVLEMTGLVPLRDFQLHLSLQPTCTDAVTEIPFTGSASSYRYQVVGVFSAGSTYSYRVVQDGRTSNCVTISIPAASTATATSTTVPTATATVTVTPSPEPTATASATSTTIPTSTPSPTVTPVPTGTMPPTATATSTARRRLHRPRPAPPCQLPRRRLLQPRPPRCHRPPPVPRYRLRSR